MLAGKTLSDYTNLIFTNYCQKNDNIIHKYFKDKYDKKDASLDFRLRTRDETRKHLLEEINHKRFISKKHKKVCSTVNYFERLFILASTVCVSDSAFALLVDVLLGIASSEAAIKLFCNNCMGQKTIIELSTKGGRNTLKECF